MAEIKKIKNGVVSNRVFRKRIPREAGQVVKCVKCEPDEPFPTLTSLSAKFSSHLNLGMRWHLKLKTFYIIIKKLSLII